MTEKRIAAAITAVIRAESAAQKMTAPELAKASGVPYPTLNRYLKDEREIPIAVVERVAEALGKPISWVTTEAEKRIGRSPAEILRELGAKDSDFPHLGIEDHPDDGTDQDGATGTVGTE